MKKKKVLYVVCSLCLLLCAACGKDANEEHEIVDFGSLQQQNDTQAVDINEEQPVVNNIVKFEEGMTTFYNGKEYSLIPDQTFTFNFTPFGEATFCAFAPIENQDEYDILYQVWQNNQKIKDINDPENMLMPGTVASVKAISFPDINNDGYDDIIAINIYTYKNNNDEIADQQWVKCYIGSASGEFTQNAYFENSINIECEDFTMAEVKEIVKKNAYIISETVSK